MKEFKFFKGTLNMIDDDVLATASFNDDTPEGHMNRRMLYHTNPDLYDRLRHPNNEMEQYFYDRNLRSRFGTLERHQDILRRLQMTNDSRDLNDNPIRLFQTTSVTTVNPKWWMKIKMYIQDNQDMFAVIFFAAVTICFGLIIGKILNAW
jgi:hypothetical protein